MTSPSQPGDPRPDKTPTDDDEEVQIPLEICITVIFVLCILSILSVQQLCISPFKQQKKRRIRFLIILGLTFELIFTILHSITINYPSDTHPHATIKFTARAFNWFSLLFISVVGYFFIRSPANIPPTKTIKTILSIIGKIWKLVMVFYLIWLFLCSILNVFTMKIFWYELWSIGLMITIIFGSVHLFIISVIVRKRLSITLDLFRKAFDKNFAQGTTGGTTGTMQTTGATMQIRGKPASKANEEIAKEGNPIKRERVETMENSEKEEIEEISIAISEKRMKMEKKSEVQMAKMEISEIKMEDDMELFEEQMVVKISDVKMELMIEKPQPDDQNLETKQNTSADNGRTAANQSLSPTNELKKTVSLLSSQTSIETVEFPHPLSSPTLNFGASCVTIGSDVFRFVNELIANKNASIDSKNVGEKLDEKIDEKAEIVSALPNIEFFSHKLSNSTGSTYITYSDVLKTDDDDSEHEVSLAIIGSVTVSNENEKKDKLKKIKSLSVKLNRLRIFTPQKERSKTTVSMNSANQYPFQLEDSLKELKSNMIPHHLSHDNSTGDRAFSAEYSFAKTNSEYYVPSAVTTTPAAIADNTAVSILDSTGMDVSNGDQMVGENNNHVHRSAAENHWHTYKLVDKGRRISRTIFRRAQHETHGDNVNNDAKYKRNMTTLYEMKSMKRTVDRALFGSIACIAVASAELYYHAQNTQMDERNDHLTTPYTDLTFYILHFALIFIIYTLIIFHIYIPFCCSKQPRLPIHQSSSFKRNTVYYTMCKHMYPYKYCCNNNLNNNCCNILCFLCIPHSLNINHEHRYNHYHHKKVVKKVPLKSLPTVNAKYAVDLVFNDTYIANAGELNTTPIVADFNINADDTHIIKSKSPYHKCDALPIILYPAALNKEAIPPPHIILPIINVHDTPPLTSNLATAVNTDNWLYADSSAAESRNEFPCSGSISVSLNTAKFNRNITPSAYMSAYSLGVSREGRSTNKGVIYSYTGLKTNNLSKKQIDIKLNEMNADGKKLNRKGKPKARKVNGAVNTMQEAVIDKSFPIDILEQSVEIFDREMPDVTTIRMHRSRLSQTLTSLSGHLFSKNASSNSALMYQSISVVIFEFSHVLCTQAKKINNKLSSFIENQSLEQCQMFFGGEERLNAIRNFLEFMFLKTPNRRISKCFVITNEQCKMVAHLLRKVHLLQCFVSKNMNYLKTNANKKGMELMGNGKAISHVIGWDHALMKDEGINGKTHLLIMKLISMLEIEHEQVLYIGHNINIIKHLKKIQLCQTYLVRTKGLLNSDIEKLRRKYFL